MRRSDGNRAGTGGGGRNEQLIAAQDNTFKQQSVLNELSVLGSQYGPRSAHGLNFTQLAGKSLLPSTVSELICNAVVM